MVRKQALLGLLLVALLTQPVLASGLAPWLAPVKPPPVVDEAPSPPAWLAADPGAGSCADPARLAPYRMPDGQTADYLHTCGSGLYDAAGRPFRIVGVNWAGMETDSHAPNGLGVRSWGDVLDQVVAMGYNTLRLPYCSEAIVPGAPVHGVDYALNPDLRGLDGLGVLDRLVAGARERGLKVILDRHWTTAVRDNPVWYSREVPESRWIADWRMLAARYAGDDTVIGFDLHNEPHGTATWGSGDPATDWRLAAERAGNAVLEVSPRLLIFVEGIERYDGGWFWWGGDLQGARANPVRLAVPGRLVYSPRDYGPSVYEQGWFKDPSFPANLPALWEKHWGYLVTEGLAPVVLGELGGQSVGTDREGQWQKAILSYLHGHAAGALVWSLDPNGETGGLFSPDWQTVDAQKQALYEEMLTAAPQGGGAGQSGAARVLFRQVETDDRTSTIAFAFRVANGGPDPLDLSHLELRYWLTAGDLGLVEQVPLLDATAPADEHVQTSVVPVLPTAAGGQTHYLRVRFDSGAGSVAPYHLSDEFVVRFFRSDLSKYVQSNDYSFDGSPEDRGRLEPWDRVTLYEDGQLAWGQEPVSPSR